jgi:cysteine sulfinate desulfinase/cysteine desulfurase-like protein
MSRIYLDYNATTPVAPEVAAVMREQLDGAFGNPSSIHWAGAPARRVLEAARGQVAQLIGCTPGEIVFTSGGSESNNLALKGIFFAAAGSNPHIITTRIEHPAVSGARSHGCGAGGRHGSDPLQSWPGYDPRRRRCSGRGVEPRARLDNPEIGA